MQRINKELNPLKHGHLKLKLDAWELQLSKKHNPSFGQYCNALAKHTILILIFGILGLVADREYYPYALGWGKFCLILLTIIWVVALCCKILNRIVTRKIESET